MKGTLKKLMDKKDVFMTAAAVCAMGVLGYMAGKKITETKLDTTLWNIAANGGHKDVHLDSGDVWELCFTKKE